MSDKGFISKTCKTSQCSTVKMPRVQLENGQKTGRNISPKRIPMSNENMERCSTSLDIREMPKCELSLLICQNT